MREKGGKGKSVMNAVTSPANVASQWAYPPLSETNPAIRVTSQAPGETSLALRGLGGLCLAPFGVVIKRRYIKLCMPDMGTPRALPLRPNAGTNSVTLNRGITLENAPRQRFREKLARSLRHPLCTGL